MDTENMPREFITCGPSFVRAGVIFQMTWNAAAADRIHHIHGVGACQLQLGWEGSSLNYAFALLVGSGEAVQWEGRCQWLSAGSQEMM